MKDSEYKAMISKSFDNASAGYDADAMRFFDTSAEHIANSLSFMGNEHVLDVATGTGKTALRIASLLQNGKVTGIDLSAGMLQQAQRKAVEQNLSNVDFIQADADSLNFPKEYFDIICCSFGVFFFPDMKATLSKLLRHLKKGGSIAITSFHDGSFEPLSDLCLNRFQTYGVELPENYTWQRLDSCEKHLDLLNALGLRNIRSEVVPMGYHLRNAEHWWELVYYSGFRSFLNQIPFELHAKYKAEHLEEIKKLATEEGIWLNVETIFTKAQL